MQDKEKSVGKILPDSEKENIDKYADHLKEPMFGLQSKKEVMKEALNEEE